MLVLRAVPLFPSRTFKRPQRTNRSRLTPRKPYSKHENVHVATKSIYCSARIAIVVSAGTKLLLRLRQCHGHQVTSADVPRSRIERMSKRRASRTTSAEEDNSREAFHATRRLYTTLQARFLNNPIFLPRTLRRDCPRPRPTHRSPTVEYTSAEPGVVWSQHVPDLRCLWCASTRPRFLREHQLLLHLRVTHAMLVYRLERNAAAAKPAVISMRLLRGAAGAHASAIDRFHAYDMEEIFVNLTKYPTYLRGQLNPNPSVKTEAERKHPSVSTPNPRVSRRAEARKKKRTATGNPAFSSVERAAADGRLFHSMLQTPLCIQAFRDGADSDDDAEEENRWRLQLMDTEIEEFVDTIPVEKLFMTLWNQFVRVEFCARADLHMAPACLEFAKKYRKTLIRLSLEATFLRHLTEVGRRGLLDADTIFAAVKVLENRNMSDQVGEKEPRFWFAERFLAQEAKRKRLEQERMKEQEPVKDQKHVKEDEAVAS